MSCHIVLEDKIPFKLLIPIDVVLGVPERGWERGTCPFLSALPGVRWPGPAVLVAQGGTAALLFSSSAGI